MERGREASSCRELTPLACELAQRAALYQSRLPPPLAIHSTISPAAEEEVLQECNEAWQELGKFQNKLTLCEPRTEVQDAENPLAVLLARERVLLAQLNILRSREPKPLLVNQELLTCVGKKELQNTNQQLEMILSCVRSRKKSLREQLDREKTWLAEEQEIENSLQDRGLEGQVVSQSLSENSALQKMKRDMERLAHRKERLLAVLGSFLDLHYPPPEEAMAASKKKRLRGSNAGGSGKLVTFHEMLECLMTRAMSSPHDPYVEVDESNWPPYVEVLLRYGLALRHPDDPRRIRLEDFHE
ncbi:centromere protein K isoform X2 [Narcine bancroftii]|uniref:centromere protein K isoform X2 n=1 Tax=Narcine bancroftii TaxID=1343680 RepID=UPI003831A8DD